MGYESDGRSVEDSNDWEIAIGAKSAGEEGENGEGGDDLAHWPRKERGQRLAENENRVSGNAQAKRTFRSTGSL